MCSGAHACSSSPGDVLTAHQRSWKVVPRISIDSFKDIMYKPKLRGLTPPETELDFFMLFFPLKEMDDILACTNAALRGRRKSVSQGEFFRVIGLLFLMTLCPSRSIRREYWSTDDGLLPAPAFGRRYGMSVHRFEEILNAMNFDMEPSTADTQDNWWRVRKLVEMCNMK